MIIQKKTSSAIEGNKVRACESCLKNRASWFCAADDASLCHACDSLVHRANELAGRHKRVRLGTASCKPRLELPSWHQGFTKKARTPRSSKAKPLYNNNTYFIPVVPEVCNDDNEDYAIEENEENDDMVFSVPTFDFNKNNDNIHNNNHGVIVRNELEENDEIDDGFNISLIGFNSDEWDVESLVDQNQSIKMDEEGFNHIDNENLHVCFPRVKLEEEGQTTNDHCFFDWSIDIESEMLNFDLNYNCVNNDEFEVSVNVNEKEGEKNMVMPKKEDGQSNNMQAKKRQKVLLRLNYEDVINAWYALGCSSPWTTGQRPEFNLDHGGWPNCMGIISPTEVDLYGRVEKMSGYEGREARVSRYREKRRTRLFSKKIRYQVRKLNAEKRPRFKGRFVKRTSLSPLSPYLVNK